MVGLPATKDGEMEEALINVLLQAIYMYSYYDRTDGQYIGEHELTQL